ncbi:DUF6470 family protein [Sutcliffiella cohnii]
MQFPQIRLQSTFGKIDLQMNKPQQEIRQRPAELSIEQPKADMQIRRTPSMLSIDQTQAWEDMDLKHISRRIEEAAQLGKQAIMEGMARRAEQGDELMKIEYGGNPMPSQAKRNSENPEKQINVGWIPAHFSVKIDYEPSKVEIDVTPQKAIIDVQVQKPEHNYTPGSVDVNIAQYPSLQIDFDNLRYVVNYEQQI